MKYMIITMYNEEAELAVKVNEKLKHGWDLHGTVQVVVDNENLVYVQALKMGPSG